MPQVFGRPDAEESSRARRCLVATTEDRAFPELESQRKVREEETPGPEGAFREAQGNQLQGENLYVQA